MHQTSRYVSLPGYAYKTDPACERTQPPSQFDERCDCPKLGFKGFTPPATCGGGI
ncbi:conserved hypothetical protein (plasmid) [Sinorhizobium fredii HH103]|uniref:Uncharacterized protein n=1 Tax=Sinorhizobium fredii (strain USDA 257) TaxID=1185652 RepID=I3XFZ3_SINF2|nr:hypothetical protein USDA257_p00810 [Sinorhizobium fredii USDA 257]CCE99085.1 hypothetical protein SFHH103_04611 [Sinorhizobium fredii HH103]CEO91770.1 conserved hypothetical protein [Sinorhizobium fredii HH103]